MIKLWAGQLGGQGRSSVFLNRQMGDSTEFWLVDIIIMKKNRRRLEWLSIF